MATTSNPTPSINITPAQFSKLTSLTGDPAANFILTYSGGIFSVKARWKGSEGLPQSFTFSSFYPGIDRLLDQLEKMLGR